MGFADELFSECSQHAKNNVEADEALASRTVLHVDLEVWPENRRRPLGD